jgi:hypothetical protein
LIDWQDLQKGKDYLMKEGSGENVHAILVLKVYHDVHCVEIFIDGERKLIDYKSPTYNKCRILREM